MQFFTGKMKYYVIRTIIFDRKFLFIYLDIEKDVHHRKTDIFLASLNI